MEQESKGQRGQGPQEVPVKWDDQVRRRDLEVPQETYVGAGRSGRVRGGTIVHAAPEPKPDGRTLREKKLVLELPMPLKEELVPALVIPAACVMH